MFDSDSSFQIIGHQGAGGYVPGNTRASIQKAIQLGADAIEVDVQLTRDQELVVFHDDHLKNIEGYNRPISEVTLDEIKEVYPDDLFGDRYSDERVMTVPHLIDEFVETIPLILDLKGNRLDPAFARDIVDTLVPVLDDKQVYDRLLLCSFDHQLLLNLKERQPALNTGMTFGAHLVLLEEEIRTVQPDALLPYWVMVSEELLECASDMNLTVYPWTINDVSEARHMEHIGVDGVITDFPDRIIQWRQHK